MLRHQVDHDYIYVFVRKDLPCPQKAVQACHSVLEATQKFKDQIRQHPSIIVLGVSLIQLLNIQDYLESKEIQFCPFYEPDIGNELTSISTEVISGSKRKLFRKFQLLKCKGVAA